MAKDWTGNFNSIYKTLGASNHTEEEREEHDEENFHYNICWRAVHEVAQNELDDWVC